MSEINLTTVDRQVVAHAFRLTQALMLRAAKVVSGVPFRRNCYDDGCFEEGCFPRIIEIDGDKATFYWNECECDREGDRTINLESCQFPSSLLFVSDDEVDKFHIETKIEEDRQERLRIERYRAEQAGRGERAERALLAKLKAKYPD